MNNLRLLGREWRSSLAGLISGAERELFVITPYISVFGSEFFASHLPPRLRETGSLFVLTDLSPLPICQGSTDPVALRTLANSLYQAIIYHLPKIHAKIYIADASKAIVTSGNLTAGGLVSNYEYGVEVTDFTAVARIRQDSIDYAELGTRVSLQRLDVFCEIAQEVRKAFQKQLSSIASEARTEFLANLQTAEDELLRLRLTQGPIHTIFAKTILYLLNQNGPLSTQQLHDYVEEIHPDLCDNSVDRVIDGQHFGKKWKHAVRTAQQQLKKRGVIELQAGLWTKLGS